MTPLARGSGVAGVELYECDWLAGARVLAPASIDLLYADLPFNTGRTQMGTRGSAASYTDSWPTNKDYVDWLRRRLVATMPAMKQTGSVLLHADFRVCHHIRLLLDELLGEHNFVNHLIWSYGLGGSSPRRFARKHDDILFYSICPDNYYFEPPMVPATSRRMAGMLKKATDVIAIASLNNQALERTGYPTQKPLSLLTMLVTACSPIGGTVLDPCCGSGTTLIAAHAAGRRAIGFDISVEAVAASASRLKGVGEAPPGPARRVRGDIGRASAAGRSAGT